MSNWKKYGYAVVKGALRAIPVAGHVIEEVLNVAEKDDAITIGIENALVQSLPPPTIEIGIEASWNPETSSEALEVVGSSMFEVLDNSKKEQYEVLLKTIYTEDDIETKILKSREMILQLVTDLTGSIGFEKAVSMALKIESADKPASSMKDLVGKLIDGRFQVIEEIGRGGFGVVYEAIDRTFDSKCAIKILKIANVEHIQRFRREARMSFMLGKETGIVRAYHKGRIGEGAYLAMDLIENAEPLDLRSGTLRQRLQRYVEACKIIARVHQRNIIHRDLKPGNFLQDKNGKVHLSDFGLAKTIGGNSDLSDEEYALSMSGMGGMRGTPAYMSPEQFQNFNRVCKKTDVYAMGIMLYEVLVGKRPFKGNDPTAIIRQQMAVELGQKKLPNPSIQELDCPEILSNLCLSSFAIKKEDRLKTADMIVEAISTFLGLKTINFMTPQLKIQENKLIDAPSMSGNNPFMPEVSLSSPHVELKESDLMESNGKTFSVEGVMPTREMAFHNQETLQSRSMPSRQGSGLPSPILGPPRTTGMPKLGRSYVPQRTRGGPILRPYPVWHRRAVYLLGTNENQWFRERSNETQICNLDHAGVLSIFDVSIIRGIKIKVEDTGEDVDLVRKWFDSCVFELNIQNDRACMFNSLSAKRSSDFELEYDCGELKVGAGMSFSFTARADDTARTYWSKKHNNGERDVLTEHQNPRKVTVNLDVLRAEDIS